MIATTDKQQEVWLRNFEEFDNRVSAAPWLQNLRRAAFARFWELGFPTTHNEDWRFTNVSALAQTPFAIAPWGTRLSSHELEGVRPHSACCQLVFINGRYAPELSRFGHLPKGVKVGSLAEAIAANERLLEQYLARESYESDGFTALNTAFIEDGAFVNVPRGTIIEQPIYVLYISAESREPVAAHPRNLMVCGEDSQAQIVEDYVSLGSAVVFSNVVTELIAGDNAVISHYLVEREDRQAYNVSTLRIHQGRNANVSSHSVLLGGAIVRNNVHPVLAGEGGECLINGLFIGSGKQHLDNYMKVEHAAPHCGSRQFYNGILDERAHGVFHGRIIVHKDAQKTDAKQTNRNLLLSDDAQVDTKPQLEIYADDVKCTHGATIGQIDEEALFYLRSRGLPDAQARALLLYAFASESLERMKAGPVRDWLEGLIGEFLPKGVAVRSGRAGEGRRWEEVG